MDCSTIKMIKRYSVFLCLLVCLGQIKLTFAQGFRSNGRVRGDMRSNYNSIDNTPGMHRIETIKTKFLSENMDLGADESNRFWPIYEQYQKELNAVLHQKRQNMLNSNKSSQDIVNDNFEYDTKILNIKKQYNQEFAKILPPDKLAQFYRSQTMFNEEMIQRLKHGKN